MASTNYNKGKVPQQVTMADTTYTMNSTTAKMGSFTYSTEETNSTSTNYSVEEES